MVIVQLGANKGNDGLTHWLKENNPEITQLVLVEPFHVHHQSLLDCYSEVPNKVIDSVAIDVQPGKFTLYYSPDDAPNYHVSSLTKEHIIKHYSPTVPIEELEVEVITLEQLLKKHKLHKVDWLLVDIEGVDADVVLSFPWSEFDIRRVDIEWLHLGNKLLPIKQMFHNLGYTQTKGRDLEGYDIGFEKNEKQDFVQTGPFSWPIQNNR